MKFLFLLTSWGGTQLKRSKPFSTILKACRLVPLCLPSPPKAMAMKGPAMTPAGPRLSPTHTQERCAHCPWPDSSPGRPCPEAARVPTWGAGRGFLSGAGTWLICFAGFLGHCGAQTMPGLEGPEDGRNPESGGKGIPLPMRQLWVRLLPLT